MIDFMYQLDGPSSTQVKHYFWVCLWKYFWIRLVAESVDSINCPLQRGWASSNLLRAWIEQKVKKGEKLPLTFLLHCMTWNISTHLLLPLDRDLYHWLSWFSSLWTWAELHTTFPRSPAGRQQIVRLLSFHNCVSQFLIINLHIFMFPIGSVSLENLDCYLGQVT